MCQSGKFVDVFLSLRPLIPDYEYTISFKDFDESTSPFSDGYKAFFNISTRVLLEGARLHDLVNNPNILIGFGIGTSSGQLTLRVER